MWPNVTYVIRDTNVLTCVAPRCLKITSRDKELLALEARTRAVEEETAAEHLRNGEKKFDVREIDKHCLGPRVLVPRHFPGDP